MAREDEVMAVMESLVIATDKEVGEIMASRGYWAEGQSARVQAAKSLKNLTDLSKLERRNGFYRLPGCKSEYQQHAQLITRTLTDILIKYPHSIIFREHSISQIGLRSDAICLITKDDLGCCVILEILVNETEVYLTQKLNAWKQWSGATEYLSGLFGYRVPHFDVIPLRGGEDLCAQLPPLPPS
jgi:hypothetical protein